MNAIARLQNLYHGSRRDIRSGLLADCLMQVGIKRHAHGVDNADAVAAQNIEPLRLNKIDPLHQRPLLPLLPSCSLAFVLKLFALLSPFTENLL